MSKQSNPFAPGNWAHTSNPDKVPKNKPRRDPLVIATEKAYRASYQCKLDKLVRLEKRYKSRLALAQRGIDKTGREIRKLLLDLADSRMSEQAS